MISHVQAQESDVLENQSSLLSEYQDLSDALPDLHYYQQHPLDLNTSTSEEWQASSLLDPARIASLQEYIHKNGRLHSVYELQSIDLFDPSFIQQILPYICIREPLMSPWKDLVFRQKNELILRSKALFPKTKAYREGLYPGNAQQQYLRYSYRSGKGLQAGFTAEQDAGESYRQNGVDFYSAYVALEGKSFLRKVILGDYQVQFGQGLVLYQGFGVRKSAEILSITKNAVGLKPYRSASESGFFRGMALQTVYRHWNISTFLSFRKVDGIIRADTVSSIDESGYHRTETERLRKNSLWEQALGGHLSYTLQRLELGITSYWINYPVYQSKALLSFDYRYSLANCYVFGELANDGLHWALLQGLVASLSPKLSFSSAYRRYDPRYKAPFSNALADVSTTQNEKGWYNGLQVQFNRRWKSSAYIDLIQHPAPRYRCDWPSKGYDAVAQLSYTPDKRSTLVFRYQQEESEQNASRAEVIQTLAAVRRTRFRLDYRLKTAVKLDLHSRFERIEFQEEEEQAKQQGTLLLQSLGYTFPETGWSIDLQYLLFDISDYDARIYAAEPDTGPGSGLTMLQDQGKRWTFVIRHSFGKKLDLWLKYSQTSYDQLETIGSGNDERPGNTLKEWKAQLRWRF